MKKAFSLIELSIVILIIGIIVAGVTQASRLASQMRLNTAKTLTQSSPAASIRNMVLWLESTSDSSLIPSEASDSSPVSTWYDINPTNINKLVFTQSNTSYQPAYSASSINGLPSLKFDGSSDYFEISYDVNLNPSAFTVFAVTRIIDASAYGAIFSSRVASSFSGYMFYAAPTTPQAFQIWLGNGSTWGNSGTVSSTISLNKPTVMSATFDGSSLTLYSNGTSAGAVSRALTTTSSSNFRIGAGKNESATPDYYLNGYLGELIIFDRSLKTEERQSIEKYLSQKWGVRF